ncbi:hypothetical protein CBR_g31707 [Chara braunii]|uniref:Cellulose synthase n=1 Tax=Chara braunii TaxID=69332 RepID=A0A388JY13_CHABU|nr:hypothetical protein CBR_g31707 [Chara braunii]|eukprot:GBG62690.1 hypothetical protein CBR_g31707 [Chara braunii]
MSEENPLPLPPGWTMDSTPRAVKREKQSKKALSMGASPCSGGAPFESPDMSMEGPSSREFSRWRACHVTTQSSSSLGESFDGDGDGDEDGAHLRALSMENMIVLGSRSKNQLAVAESPGADESLYGGGGGLSCERKEVKCSICRERVGRDEEGEPFVPCECAFIICKPCYEYVREHEGGRCPQCQEPYRKLKPQRAGRCVGRGGGMGDGHQTYSSSLAGEDNNVSGANEKRTQTASGLRRPLQVGSPVSISSNVQDAYVSEPESLKSLGAIGRSTAPRHRKLCASNEQEEEEEEEEGEEVGQGQREEGQEEESALRGDMTVVPLSISASPLMPDSLAKVLLSFQTLDPNKTMLDYGYGSIHWIESAKGGKGGGGGGGDGGGGDAHAAEAAGKHCHQKPILVDDTKRPLSRVIPVAAALINPYRFMVVVRFITLAFFLHYRIQTPNPDAYVLWLASVSCEIWFGISWVLDQVPKWSPITRETYLDRLSLKYEKEGEPNKLLPVDVFVSTADPEKEPPLVTANVVLSVLAMDYPVDKLACYLSDDGAAMLTFETLTETASFARAWVPFCKKYDIEPRAPEVYFQQKIDYTKGKTQPDFIKERRHMKRAYDEFKVRINALVEKSKNVPPDGWKMADGSPWPGNVRNDHVGMIQVFLQPDGDTKDINGEPMPRLVYVSREKRPGYDHNKKAGAMNALMRSSALITNGPFILNLDCDHYVHNARAIREAMCFLMDFKNGNQVCYVQFPQRFDGVDRNDRYANHNAVFFDINMKALDGLQGPMYVGTGCVFRRQALYGFCPPERATLEAAAAAGAKVEGDEAETGGGGRCCGTLCSCCCLGGSRGQQTTKRQEAKRLLTAVIPGDRQDEEQQLVPTQWHASRFGMCPNFVATVVDAEGGVPDVDPYQVLSDVILVISCGYEDDTEWGRSVGWMYGSVTEDIVTGLMMHINGWHSVYCMPKRAAFKGSAPINLTDRLGQVLRWATGSVEIFFSKHNPITRHYFKQLMLLQRVAYINTAVYPFTSIALLVYCFLPAICLFTNQFIVNTIDGLAVLWFLMLFVSIFTTSILEIRWSGVAIEDWWRNEQFWVIGGTSAHLAAVIQGVLKVLAGVDTSFTLTQKGNDDEDNPYAELYAFRWTWLMVPPTAIMTINIVACFAGLSREMYKSPQEQNWGRLLGMVFFAFWVLSHLYPFAKGLMGKNNKTPTIVIVWSILLAIILSLLWVRIVA